MAADKPKVTPAPTETEPAKLAPQKIQVRVQQTSTPQAEPKEYWIEAADGTGKAFPVNARTYNKTFKNNTKFRLSTQPEIKKK